MSTTSTPARSPRIQRLIDSRPPSLTWARPSPLPRNQPQLDLIDQETESAEPAGNDRGVGMSTVKARWAARRDAGYLMPRSGAPSGRWRSLRRW
jgi:hypothetical protein